MNYSTLTSLLLCLLLGAPAWAEPYQVVTEVWAPYNYEENGQLTGMTTEIVQAIMAVNANDFKIVLAPSMRASHTLRMRPKTIMYSMFRTPQREALYKWVGPIVEESIHPYQLATSPPITSLEQLLHVPQITTRHAGLLPDMLESLGFKNLDKSATESVQLYRMLLNHRTAIIIGDTDAGVAYQSRQLNIAPGTLRQIPIELYRSSLYIAFSRDCEDELVASWASALETLRQSGELERIQRRYTQPAAQ
ncbi:transporter substrate-binding domain-containing protein [Pseudomonas syringae]|uniref:substrate-binding periplasmic protein n=1 Tax=Pseudomonas syringae TaxID=317 RepID=UPI001F4822BE|nr:transporter substrate-binding domain-containing protein [Pseudomonas syringae]MCF5709649.1 transporter substrate-binding domain-containing protein [Pseudomonas syringae]